MGDFVIQVSYYSQFCHNSNCFSLGVWAVYVAGGDILGVILAQQRGHLRQDFFRWVKKLSEAGKRLAKLIPASPPWNCLSPDKQLSFRTDAMFGWEIINLENETLQHIYFLWLVWICP